MRETLEPHPLHSLIEPLLDIDSYLEKQMFGCRAGYAFGRLVIVLACPGEEPWNGALFPVEREMRSLVLHDFPQLRPHSVLPKWLYIAEDDPRFEEVVMRAALLIARDDPRFGVIPQPKKPKKAPRRKGGESRAAGRSRR